MKKRILLTGSTSYVGTKFVELYGPQFEILGVSRTDKRVPLDLLDFEEVRSVFRNFKPDVLLHLAADLGRDSTINSEIMRTNPAITSCLIELAQEMHTPVIFTSTEAVYGGREDKGGYKETDEYKPRSPYAASKVASEELLTMSGLPYLITRGHRHVGISKNFHNSKQFPDTLRMLSKGQKVHADSKKLFTPVLINNACDIFAQYISKDTDRQIIINIGSEKATTYYDFMVDIARVLNFDSSIVQPDGSEEGWALNSSLSIQKLKDLHYPSVSYQEMLETIKRDFIEMY